MRLRLGLYAVLVFLALGGCTAKAPIDHIVHVEVHFGAVDGPLARVTTVSLTLHPSADQDQDTRDLSNATSDPTFTVPSDVPSVRVHVQGAPGCTSEAGDELFLPVGQRDVATKLVVYARHLHVGKVLHFDPTVDAKPQDIALAFPKGQEQAYLDRLEDGNATVAWATDATHQGSFSIAFRWGKTGEVSSEGGPAPMDGPARSDVSLGYANARKAALEGGLKATVSNAELLSPTGFDVHVDANLYFSGKGKVLADVLGHPDPIDCILPG